MEPHVKLLIAVAHALAGIVLVGGLYRAIEYRLQAGILFGAALAITVLAADFTIGPILFDLTYAEQEQAAWAAAIGAVGGITLFATLFEPELESDGTTEFDVNDLEP
jgi:hypothetical protein